MVMARRSRSCGCAILAAAVAFVALSEWLVGYRSVARTTAHAHVQRPAPAESYPNLARVEGMIQDSCGGKEGEAQEQCLRMWDKLTKFHEESEVDFNLDQLRSIVLYVLDRLCAGIQTGVVGPELLDKVSTIVGSLRSKFTSCDNAFLH
eukprot:TRINITY_DN15241_c0_g1_i4.p1 TRINITY_DN15241_c0_g1~~TRINITY_DN15241_c0_g1_i4.p1  ORF type:complete len:149 (+),score=23.26 TRINITY_DN15241_c0_g1_i4:98-544(+)